MERRGSEEAVDGGNGLPGRREKPAPAIGYGSAHGQEPALEPGGEILLEPQPETFLARAVLQPFDTFSNLAEAEDAEMERVVGDFPEPAEDGRARTLSDQLGDDVRVEKVAHTFVSRAGERSRSIRRSIPTSGDRRMNSRKLGFRCLRRS